MKLASDPERVFSNDEHLRGVGLSRPSRLAHDGLARLAASVQAARRRRRAGARREPSGAGVSPARRVGLERPLRLRRPSGSRSTTATTSPPRPRPSSCSTRSDSPNVARPEAARRPPRCCHFREARHDRTGRGARTSVTGSQARGRRSGRGSTRWCTRLRPRRATYAPAGGRSGASISPAGYSCDGEGPDLVAPESAVSHLGGLRRGPLARRVAADVAWASGCRTS